MKDLSNELTIKLMNIFRETDERPTIKYFMPIEFYGIKWVVKTTSHHFIMIPENEDNKVEKPTEKVVDFAAILPVLELQINLPIETLKAVYDSIPMISRKQMIECDRCDGGEFEYEGYDYECKHCEGGGEIWNNKYETVKEEDAKLVFNEQRLKHNFVKDLIAVAELTDCKNIQIRHSERNMILFQLDDSIIIGIMACLHVSSDSKYNVI